MDNRAIHHTVNNQHSISSNTINIYVDERPDNSFSIYDKNDACMNAVISSFSMNQIATTNAGLYTRETNAIFHLHDLDSMNIQYISTIDVSTLKLDKKFILACAAVESILTKLARNDCVQTNQAVIFQSRKNNIFDGNQIMMPNVLIPVARGVVEKNLQKALISHTYAYLDEGRISVCFKPLTQQQENNIKSVLRGLFKERDCGMANDNQQKVLLCKN